MRKSEPQRVLMGETLEGGGGRRREATRKEAVLGEWRAGL